jgi:RNA polymerase sigma-70 factor (ECF subfamily)
LAWVQRAREGDREAFGHLVELYQRRAVAVAYRLLGRIEDAMEVTQEAFLRAFRNVETLDEPAAFGAWMLRIVSNLSLNFRRSRRRGAQMPLEELLTSEGEMAGIDEGPRETGRVAPPPGSKMAAAELEDAVREHLADLPERQRMALLLFSVEQMPQKQVAAVLNCSIEAVKWYVFQARKTLRDKLAEFL